MEINETYLELIEWFSKMEREESHRLARECFETLFKDIDEEQLGSEEFNNG